MQKASKTNGGQTIERFILEREMSLLDILFVAGNEEATYNLVLQAIEKVGAKLYPENRKKNDK
jgi:hypothetical protein